MGPPHLGKVVIVFPDSEFYSRCHRSENMWLMLINKAVHGTPDFKPHPHRIHKHTVVHVPNASEQMLECTDED